MYVGIIGYILGVYWDNGKDNGNSRDYSGTSRSASHPDLAHGEDFGEAGVWGDFNQ